MVPRPYLWFALTVLALLPILGTPAVLTSTADRAVEDRLSGLRNAIADAQLPSPAVTIVAVDEESLSSSPERWVFGPATLARALDNLSRLRPGAIGVAVPPMIAPPTDDPAGYARLLAALSASGRVVLRDPASAALSATTTAVSWHPDIVRTAAARGGGGFRFAHGPFPCAAVFTSPSFPLELIQRFQPTTKATLAGGVLTIRTAFSHQVALGLKDGTDLEVEMPQKGRIEVVPFARVLAGDIPRKSVEDRIVLVGPTAPAIAAVHDTGPGRLMTEVELDAAVIDALLCGRHLARSGLAWRPFVMAFALFLAAAAGLSLRRGAALPAALLAALAVPAISTTTYVTHGVTPDLLPWSLSSLLVFAAITLIRSYETLLLSGRSAALITHLARALSGAAGRMLDEAIDLARRGHHDQAAALIRSAMQTDPSVTQRALYQLIFCHLARHDIELVEDTFDQLDISQLSLDDAYTLGLRMVQASCLESAKALFVSIANRDLGFRDVKQQLDLVKQELSSRKDVIDQLVVRELRRDYQNLEPMRRGGMSIVYRAFSQELGRSVAIKILTPHLNGDTNIAARFFLEADTLREFDCPNIVKVYRVEKDGPLKYYVMEHVHPSVSLRELIDREIKLAIPRACSILKQVCTALDFAHTRNVIHRDIKPQNILMAQDDVVKLIDFGIARFDAISTMTSTGVIMGTPRYMSPEQIKGQRVDHRTDIYSVGVVFFEMLSGLTGTENPTVEKMRGQTTIFQLILRQNLPNALVRIILKCLEGSRERRYATVRELARDITDFEQLPPSDYDL